MIEALGTEVTHVGFFSLLEHPLLWGAGIRHGFPGQRWGKHRILQVGFVMARQRRGVIEALVAVPAGVGLPSSVDLLVLLEVALADEALPAHVAFVRLLARVDPLVLSEGGGGRETFSTLGTAVGFVSKNDCCVGFLVLLQVGSCREALATLTASIWLLPSVDLLVLFQVSSTNEALSALSTFVWLVLRMHLHVFSQSDCSGKALTTL